MTTWVTSGVTWETTTAPMRLANFFTVIWEWKKDMWQVSLLECATQKAFLTPPADWGLTPRSPAASPPGFALSQAGYSPCLRGRPLGNHHSFQFSQLSLTQACWVFSSLLENKKQKILNTNTRSHSPLSSSLTRLCDAAGFGPSGLRSSFAIRKARVGILFFFCKSFSWKEENKKLDKSSGL